MVKDTDRSQFDNLMINVLTGDEEGKWEFQDAVIHLDTSKQLVTRHLIINCI